MLATNTSAVDGIVIEALLLAVKLSAPAALAALLVGFLASLFQTATQLQEQTIPISKLLSGSAKVADELLHKQQCQGEHQVST